MKLMVLGTSSGAGKSMFSAMLCRYFTTNGVDVAPFKASNLSSNSLKTRDRGEIGLGQALQAAACNKEPTKHMNPILLKPSGKGSVDVKIAGKNMYKVSPGCRPGGETLVPHALKSYDLLASMNQMVVCEGSGSPVELNLMDYDLANLRMVRERNIPSIIVADIERGGMFAALYGTWLLTPEDLRKNLKGYVINRFRGDPSILKGGIDHIEEITGMECLGIVPYTEVDFPAEDTIKYSGKFTEDDAEKYRLALDGLIDLCKDSVDFGAIGGIASGN